MLDKMSLAVAKIDEGMNGGEETTDELLFSVQPANLGAEQNKERLGDTKHHCSLLFSEFKHG